MRYHSPVAAVDPNASYINADASNGIRGSAPPAESIEYPMREIVNAITLGGLTPNDNDLTQLWQVISKSDYAVDVGTLNAVVINPSPSASSYRAGMRYSVKVAVTNQAPTTINVSGLGARGIIRENGTALIAGDIVSQGIALIEYDGLNFQLLNPVSSLISEQSLLHYGVDTGVANAYVAVVTPGIVNYDSGLAALIYTTHASTGASTINLNGLGVKSIVKNNGSAIAANDIPAGGLIWIAFDGTNFELLNSTVSGGGAQTFAIYRPYWIAVNSATVMSPPGSPVVGDTYCVPVGATGAWSGLDNQISQWTGAGGWVTVNMPIQSMIGIGDQDDFWKRTGSGWRSIWATVTEAAAGISTTLGVTPAGLRRAASIVGPLWPYFVSVKSQSVAAPPGSPTLGDVYCVPSGATGAWSGLANYLVQWDGSQWLSRSFPTDTMIGIADTDDWQVRRGGGGAWRTAYATFAEALAGTSTTLIINPADLAYVLAHQPGGGDDLLSNLLWYGCL